MKYMDIHYHLIHEYVEDGMVKIEFDKSEENNADLFTKNLLAIYLRSMQRYLCGSMMKLMLRHNRKGVKR